MFRDHVPARDGAVPARLREGGAILLGKTATHELGMGITTNNHFYGPTLNPWNSEHVPGGSSGGAAAAAAAELGLWQVGTDGGGSIRIPASFCGVVGHKPTLGLVSNRGQFGNGNVSFSVPGPLARTVRDAAIATQALAGFDPEYAYARSQPIPDLLADLERGVAGLRVGTSARSPPARARRGASRPLTAATLDRLVELGAAVEQVAMPHHDLLQSVTFAVFAIEGGTQTRGLIGDRPRLFSPAVERLVGDPPSDPAFWAHMCRDRAWIAHDYAAAFARVDVLVVPTTPAAGAVGTTRTSAHEGGRRSRGRCRRDRGTCAGQNAILGGSADEERSRAGGRRGQWPGSGAGLRAALDQRTACERHGLPQVVVQHGDLLDGGAELGESIERRAVAGATAGSGTRRRGVGARADGGPATPRSRSASRSGMGWLRA